MRRSPIPSPDELPNGEANPDLSLLFGDSAIPDGFGTDDGFLASAGGVPDQFAALVAERDELVALVRQVQADFENYRRRSQRDAADAAQRSLRNFAQSLLPVLDTFVLTLGHLEESSTAHTGMVHAHSALLDACAFVGLVPIDSDGADFDPMYHEAVAHEPDADTPVAVVVETLRVGYLLDGTVVRPAMVRVRG